jgi:hypothetical protein
MSGYRTNSSKRIVVKEVAEFTRQPYIAAFTPNIISGFTSTEIEPFNIFGISDDRFLASLVTDRDEIGD